MPCIDLQRRLALRMTLLGVAAGLNACGNRQAPVASPEPSPAPAAATTPADATPADAPPAPDAVPQAGGSEAVAPDAPAARARPPVRLPAPATPRSLHELQLQVARRLVAAHPDTSYTERAPDRLLAIPVLEIELHADGSVRRIAVLRRPTTGNEATTLAIAAVRRAAPYGDVSRLPKPWKVVETFLFDDQLRFKPRTLDLD